MATRAARAAPIQKVLRESGIHDPFHSRIRSLNAVATTLEPLLFRCKEHGPFGPGSCNMFHLRQNRSQRRSMENPKGSVECGISLARHSRRGEEGFI
jgi:hypothetical protein